MSESIHWSWKRGETYPSFVVCRRCRVYRCSQWAGWSPGAPCTCGQLMTKVHERLPPPPDYRADLTPLEQLAAIAKEPGWNS